MNNETHRPSPRSQRAGRGPEDRRRRAGTSGSGATGASGGPRRLERHQRRDDAPRRETRDPRGSGDRRATRDGRFIDGDHGSDPREGSRGPARPTATGPAGRPAPTGRWATLRGVWGPHVRRFAPGILANHGVTVAVAVAVAVILAIGTTFRAVPAYIGSVWLAANLSPLTISGADLGVAPLLPALVIFLVHSRRIRAACGTTITVRGIRALAVVGTVVPALLTVVAWFMLWDASHVFDVAPPNLLHALVTTVLLNGAAVAAGLGPKIWRALLLRRGLSTWPVESVLLAGRFLTVMLVTGAVAVGVGLLVNHVAVGRAFDIAGGAGGVLGLSLLSLLYFPNLAVGGAAVLMGGEMHIGEGSASLFAVTNTTLPPLPVLAVMPNDVIPLGPLLMLVPAVIAVYTVYRWFAGRRYIESPLFTAGGAGLCAGAAGLLLAWVAGGDLGYYGSTGPLLWLTPLLFLVWLVLPSLVVFGWVAWSGSRVRETGSAVSDRADTDAGTGADPTGGTGRPASRRRPRTTDVTDGDADDDGTDTDDDGDGAEPGPTATIDGADTDDDGDGADTDDDGDGTDTDDDGDGTAGTAGETSNTGADVTDPGTGDDAATDEDPDVPKGGTTP